MNFPFVIVRHSDETDFATVKYQVLLKDYSLCSTWPTQNCLVVHKNRTGSLSKLEPVFFDKEPKQKKTFICTVCELSPGL